MGTLHRRHKRLALNSRSLQAVQERTRNVQPLAAAPHHQAHTHRRAHTQPASHPPMLAASPSTWSIRGRSGSWAANSTEARRTVSTAADTRRCACCARSACCPAVWHTRRCSPRRSEVFQSCRGTATSPYPSRKMAVRSEREGGRRSDGVEG